MAEVGEATQNAHAERLMRTIKEEEVNLSDYRDYYDARQRIGRFSTTCISTSAFTRRWAISLPSEYETQWRARTINSNQTVPLKT